jgi:hypothetical protein
MNLPGDLSGTGVPDLLKRRDIAADPARYANFSGKNGRIMRNWLMFAASFCYLLQA